MDCKKVGQLILKLRNEKGLTQKQVADSLNISNKTVSKWECGMGCPDVTLWTVLSEVLGADILKLLEGELKPNKPDIGKIEKVKFYVCPSCNNILISTGEATISCCGRKLAMLKPVPQHDEHEVTIQEIDMQHYSISFKDGSILVFITNEASKYGFETKIVLLQKTLIIETEVTKMRDKPRTFSAGKDSAGRL